MRAPVLCLLLVLAWAPATGLAEPCQCEPPDLFAAYLDGEWVFQARIGQVSRVHPGQGMELSLSVQQVWKGSPGEAPTLWLPRGRGEGTCQQQLPAEGSFLFLVPAQQPLRPTGCAGSVALEVSALPPGWQSLLAAMQRGEALPRAPEQ